MNSIALGRLPLAGRLAIVAILSILLTVAAHVLGLDGGGVAIGAVTLAQAATLSQNDLQAGVIETFIMESPVLDRIPLKRIEGNAYAYNVEATLPGIEFRAVNTAYNESTGTVNQKSETLVILGGDADVDTFIQATRSNLNDQRAEQDRMKVKAASFKFQDAFFNGDVAVDANSFDGLKKRLTGAQVLTPPAANGIPVVGNGTTDIDVFLDYVDALLDAALIEGDNGALYMNDLIRSKFRAAARRKTLVTDGEAVFGNVTKKVTFYRGTPILNPGLNLSGTRILPQTETTGASAVTSSIYAVRWGQGEADGAVTGLFNGGNAGDGVFDVRDLGEQQAKPAYRTRIEGFLGLAVFGGQGAARAPGFLNL